MIKFEKIRPGEYRAQLRPGTWIWVSRHTRSRWVWYIGGYDGHQAVVWETDDNGPFPTRKEAIEDAIANYEDFLS